MPASFGDRGTRRLVWAVAFVASLGALGCVKKPTMTLHHAEISGISFGFPPKLGVLMTVVVAVNNPNSYDVAVRGVRGRVLFAQRYNLPVTYKAPGDGAWLPSKVTTLVRVPVDLPVGLATAVLEEAYFNPMIPYRFTGKADVTASRTFKFEVDDYSVDEQGWVSRQQVDAVLRGALHPLAGGPVVPPRLGDAIASFAPPSLRAE
ncbi:MAG: LEA type 2 family protein [Polyangiaceae bacterium]|nr:LEA type 2 family protein [Polyangiaceae bacterium]